MSTLKISCGIALAAVIWAGCEGNKKSSGSPIGTIVAERVGRVSRTTTVELARIGREARMGSGDQRRGLVEHRRRDERALTAG